MISNGLSSLLIVPLLIEVYLISHMVSIAEPNHVISSSMRVNSRNVTGTSVSRNAKRSRGITESSSTLLTSKKDPLDIYPRELIGSSVGRSIRPPTSDSLPLRPTTSSSNAEVPSRPSIPTDPHSASNHFQQQPSPPSTLYHPLPSTSTTYSQFKPDGPLTTPWIPPYPQPTTTLSPDPLHPPSKLPSSPYPPTGFSIPASLPMGPPSSPPPVSLFPGPTHSNTDAPPNIPADQAGSYFKNWTTVQIEINTFRGQCTLPCWDNCKLNESRSNNAISLGCYCDLLCVAMGDCCIDYEFSCLDQGSQPNATNYLEILENRTDALTKCKEINTGESVNKFYMIDGCNNSSNQSLISRCAEDKYKSFEHLVPVFYFGLLYSNAFCLQCNHVDIDDNEIIPFELEIKCEPHSSLAFNILTRNGHREFEEYVLKNCGSLMVYPSASSPGLAGVETSESRYVCSKQSTGDATCKPSEYYADKKEEFERIKSYCRRYRSEIGSTDRMYRWSNVHCSLCHFNPEVPEYSRNDFCFPAIKAAQPPRDPSNGRRFPSFKMLLNFGSGSSDKLSYGQSEICKIHDFSENKCLKLVCPPGQMQTVEDMNDGGGSQTICSPINGLDKIKQPLHDVLPRNRFMIMIIDYPVEEYMMYYSSLLTHILPSLDTLFLPDEPYPSPCLITFKSMKIRPCMSLGFNETNGELNSQESGEHEWMQICVIFEMETPWMSILDDIARQYVNIAGIRLDKVYAKLKRLMVANYNPQTQLSCTTGSSLKSIDNPILNGYSIIGEPFPTTLVDKDSEIEYPTSDIALVYEANITLTNATWLSWICESELLNCETVNVQPEDYYLLPNKLLKYDQIVINLKGYNPLTLDPNLTFHLANESGLLICLNSLTPTTYGANEFTLENYLTIIGNVISIVCLLFTIATYLTLKPLLTSSTLRNLNFCLALLLAQFLFMISGSVGNGVICKLVGISQQYAWLCSFIWTNVIAYDIYRTFSSPLRYSCNVNTSSKLPLSRLFTGWCVSGIYVAACVCLSELWPSQTGIKYSQTIGACFISSGLLYYFVIPLALSLLVNIVLFTCTVIKLRRALDEGQKLRKGKTTSRLLVFARLSSLMGFTWILGFAANGLSELWYVFVVANSCQGALVFVSFVCTRRTLLLWRDKVNIFRKYQNNSLDIPSKHTKLSVIPKYTPSTNDT